MKPAELGSRLRRQIPLSQAMGLQVERCDVNTGVVFRLPLKPNINHKGTAFGGTLLATQAIACWAWLMEYLAEQNLQAEVVLQRQKGRFLRPTTAEFTVQTLSLSDAKKYSFIKALAKKKKARIHLQCEVRCLDKVTTIFEGDYVALLK